MGIGLGLGLGLGIGLGIGSGGIGIEIEIGVGVMIGVGIGIQCVRGFGLGRRDVWICVQTLPMHAGLPVPTRIPIVPVCDMAINCAALRSASKLFPFVALSQISALPQTCNRYAHSPCLHRHACRNPREIETVTHH